MIMAAPNYQISLVLKQMEICRFPRVTLSYTPPNFTVQSASKIAWSVETEAFEFVNFVIWIVLSVYTQLKVSNSFNLLSIINIE